MKIKHIFLKYCVRYFLGFLIVLLACIPIVMASHSIIEKKVLENSQLRLQEGINEVEQSFSKMLFIDNIISANTYFSRLMHTDGRLLPDEYLNLSYARDQLAEFGNIYTFSPYFFVLFRENDCYVSSYQCSEFFTDHYYPLFLEATDIDGNPLDAEQFRSQLFDTSSSYIRLGSLTYYMGGSAHTLESPILYIPNSTSSSFLQDQGYRLSFVLDLNDVMHRLLTEDSINHGFIQITDSSGNLLLRYGEEVSLLDSMEPSSNYLEGEKDSYHLLSYRADGSGWNVIIGYPQSLITSKVSVLMHIITLYIVGGISIVLFLTLFYSYHQYRSVKKLFVAVPEEQKSLAIRGKNEYDTLSRIFHEVTQNAYQYKGQVDMLNQQNHAIMLENLIVRGITTQEEREKFKSCFPKPLEFFCLVLVKMNVPSEETYQPILICIVEYLKANYPNDFVTVHTGLSDELFLLSLNPSDASNVLGIRRMFQTIASALSEDSGATFHIGISAIGTDISNVNACYNQARQVTQAYINEPKNVIEIYNVDINAVHENLVNPEFLNKLYNLLLNGEKGGIEKLLERMTTYYQKMPVQYEAQKQQIFYSIRNVIFSAGLHLPSNGTLDDILPKYQASDTIRTMSRRLMDAAFQVCQLMANSHSEKKSEIRDKIIQYMEENYSDASLSISHVCRQLNISEKYLQQIIKERTGETFAASLERIRIFHAAEYLVSTTWSNEKVAEATGFAAVSTFYRVFNKVMGMSPGAYRSSRSTVQKF
ncbi:MAG TPA: AraC family transcriptional regulator [Candidatus Fimimorpha excrementavium]|nr:AraC family transcriptional regulator [Candidatus Fimimorpha excrementavium]